MKQLYLLRRACGRPLLAALLGGASLPAAAQSALTFDGASSYATTTLTALSGNEVSLECWVNVTAFKSGAASTGSLAGVVGMENGFDAALLRFGDASIAADQIQLVLGILGDQQKLESVTHFSPNTWYHVAGTYDGHLMRLYVNGVLENTGVVSPRVVSPATGTGTFTLGRDYDDSRILNGSVDEVRAWTRTLSPDEIVANACSVSPTAAGLAGYWHLNEGHGSTAADASAGNHPASFVGTPTWTTAVPTACAAALPVRAGGGAGGLQVRVLGNPAQGSTAELEIDGAQGQPTRVQLLNLLGAVVQQQELLPATAAARTTLALPAAPGLYVVRVRTPGGSSSTKIIKH